MAGFVHLHLHSEYSLLDGACRVRDIPVVAKQMGHKAVALTDHGVMYGVIEFYRACIEQGIKPIIGCEVYVAPRSRFEKQALRDSISAYHLVLLCRNMTGYKNLMYLVSRGFIDGFYNRPRIDMELLSSHSEGLIALSACLAGYIPRAISAGDFAGAREFALKMKEMFGEDGFYLELQDHGIEEQRTVNASLIRLSHECGIPLVATNDVHYISRNDADTHAILMCIQTNSVITDGRPIGFETDEFYYKSTEEMAMLFSGIDNGSPLENTVKIADMCSLELDFKTIHMPRFPFTGNLTPEEYLRRETEEGLRRRIELGHIVFTDEHPEEEYRARIEHELSVIIGMGYDEYYLIVADFIAWAKKHGIPVGPGRGSGAGSLVAYLIGITDLDPLKYGLLFERFLNPERISLPDFDVDFCYDRRDEVIEYVREKYGTEHVAQIITFGTMAARAAVRDVGRALGMSYAKVDSIAKLIPRTLNITLKDAFKQPELKDLYDSSPEVRRLIDTAQALEGMPRHASTHAAGVVISDVPLTDIVPLAVNSGTVVTQFDMDTVAQLGLVKFDFLALRYITIISNTVKRIREKDPAFDIALIPQNDQATLDMISLGHTDGVFQLESAGMRQLLMQLKPSSLNDIIAAIALFRPGPMESIPQYIEGRHGKRKINYKHPALKNILDETYGCIVYQEQVMQIFREVAGYSYARADVVRRAMAKKKADVLEAERDDFVRGATERGMSAADATELFDEMASFASYAFNKSHAACYAVISYETAYLKRHKTMEYMASLLDSVIGAEGKTADYIAECARYGIKVLPPDINESTADYTVSDDGIRFGLLVLKGLGRGFIDSIVAEREQGGRFRSFYDFARRMSITPDGGLNRRQAEALIKGGAFDSCGEPRSRLIASYERILDYLHDQKRTDIIGQLDIFSAMSEQSGETIEPEFVYPNLQEFTRAQLLAMEKQVSGMYFSGHILDDYTDELALLHPVPIVDVTGGHSDEKNADVDTDSGDFQENHGDIDNIDIINGDASAATVKYGDGDTVTVAGVITRRTHKETRAGESMMFASLEDKTGEIELVIFPKVLSRYSSTISAEDPVLVVGQISIREDEAPKILMRSIRTLTDAAEDAKRHTHAAVSPSHADGNSVINSDPAVMNESDKKLPRRLFIRVPSKDDTLCRRAVALVEIFCGMVPVFIYDASTGKYEKLSIGADTTPTLERELRLLLGDENVVWR